MPSERIAEQLSEMALLRDLSWSQQLNLSDYFLPVSISTGETLFQEGDQGDALYLLAQGGIAIVKADRTLAKIQVGCSLGEMALLDSEPRSASAIALCDCALLSLPNQQFQRLLNDHSRLATQILLRLAKLLSQRLRYAGGELIDLLAETGPG